MKILNIEVAFSRLTVCLRISHISYYICVIVVRKHCGHFATVILGFCPFV